MKNKFLKLLLIFVILASFLPILTVSKSAFATVTIANDANGNAPLYYVAITLTNSQINATGTNFQCKVTVNSNAYSSYLNSTLKNVCFQDGAGTIIKSWLESGETSSSTVSVYWLNLTSTIAANGGTQIVYEVMASTVSNSMNSTWTGAEPMWAGGTYGQYDNGIYVFPYYQSWGGLNSLPSGWSINTSRGNVTYKSTCITVNTSGTNAQYYPIISMAAPASTATYPFVLETLESVSTISLYPNCQVELTALNTTKMGDGVIFTPPNATSINLNVYAQADYGVTSGVKIINNVSMNTSYLLTCYFINSTTKGLWGMVNYSTLTKQDAYAQTTHSCLAVVVGGGVVFASTDVSWIRTRAYPPIGVMPAASFSSITAVTVIAITNAPATWTLNGITGNGWVSPNTIYYSNPLGDLIPPGATVNDTVCLFTVTNASSNVALDLTVTFGNFSGGDAMTNANNGSNSPTQFGAYAWYSGMTYSNKVIAKDAGSSVLYSNFTGATLKWGVEVKTQTNAWTTATNETASIVITATAH